MDHNDLVYKNIVSNDTFDYDSTLADIIDRYNKLSSIFKDNIDLDLDYIRNTEFDEEELIELSDIIDDALSDSEVANLEDATNENDISITEKPLGRMQSGNMIRNKHKMGINSIPKVKLKAMRIKNRVANLKKRIKAKLYYKQNHNVIARYNKSYRNAVATGRHRAATRRKS